MLYILYILQCSEIERQNVNIFISYLNVWWMFLKCKFRSVITCHSVFGFINDLLQNKGNKKNPFLMKHTRK